MIAGKKPNPKKKIKLKTISIIIVLGAILAGTAPFIHMFFPKESTEIINLKKSYKQDQINKETYSIQLKALKEKQKFIGFPNQRTFWYNMGKPITLLYFSLLLMGIYPFIGEEYLRKAIQFSAVILGFVSFYFITWVLWDRNDFPKTAYYMAMGIIAVLSTFLAIFLINHRKSLLSKIRLLTSFIVLKGKSHVPEENKKAYVKDYLKTFKKLVE